MKKIIVLFCLLIFTSAAFACTDFQIKAEDKSIIIGRTMELSIDTKSRVWVFPRGIQHQSKNTKGVTGISWTSKYGFLGIDSFNDQRTILDGINEKGLSVGALFYTGSKYQEAVPGKFLSLLDVGIWMLGNFESVDQIKEELPKINIFAEYFKPLRGIPPLHIAAHDADGKNIVIEFLDGKTIIHDNPIGVMTNRPNFDWQMNNLRNYVNLTPKDKEPVTINGTKIEPTGVGSGMLGLPGDWTPPSRFVKTALTINAALTPKNADEAVNLAEHIINIVDIPKGVIKEKINPFITLYGYTQWVVIKDLTNKVLYYRSYDDMTLRSIDLKKLNLEAGAAIKALPIESKKNTIIDMTNSLL